MTREGGVRGVEPRGAKCFISPNPRQKRSREIDRSVDAWRVSRVYVARRTLSLPPSPIALTITQRGAGRSGDWRRPRSGIARGRVLTRGVRVPRVRVRSASPAAERGEQRRCASDRARVILAPRAFSYESSVRGGNFARVRSADYRNGAAGDARTAHETRGFDGLHPCRSIPASIASIGARHPREIARFPRGTLADSSRFFLPARSQFKKCLRCAVCPSER